MKYNKKLNLKEQAVTITSKLVCHIEYIDDFFTLYIWQDMGGSPGDVSEEPVTEEKRKKAWRMNCSVAEATERLENEL